MKLDTKKLEKIVTKLGKKEMLPFKEKKYSSISRFFICSGITLADCKNIYHRGITPKLWQVINIQNSIQSGIKKYGVKLNDEIFTN